jgi:hypothetical protein
MKENVMTVSREYELVQHYNRLVAEFEMHPSLDITFNICRAKLALYFFNTQKYSKETFDRGEIKMSVEEAVL